MAARVGTVLSDEHILKECAHYRPIPMKLAEKMIDKSSISAKKSPFSSKPLKYVRELSRPAHFDAYAHSIARNLGNDPEFRGKLHGAYIADVAQHHNDNVNLPDVEMNKAVDDPHLPMMYMAGLFDLFGPNHIPPPPAPAAPPPPHGANDNVEPEDDTEVLPELTDSEDEGPPPHAHVEEHAHVPELEEENENEPVPEGNEPGPSPSPGMKLRSGKQLSGSKVKAMKTQGEYTTDPFDINVRTSDIETQKKRMAAFALQQQRLAHYKRQQLLGPNNAYFL